MIVKNNRKYYAKLGGGANMLGEILSNFTIFADTINLDFLGFKTIKSCSKIGE